MSLSLVIIAPRGPFGTPVRADILWGHYAWQVAYNPELFHGGISALVEAMRAGPRVVFGGPFIRPTDSSAWFLPRPTVPLSVIFEGYLQSAEKKLLKRRRWLRISSFDKINCIAANCTDGLSLGVPVDRVHNTISRLTGRTGTGAFALFAEQETWYKDVEWGIFISCENVDLPGVIEGLTRIGKIGYGKNASTGCGRFEVKSVESIALNGLPAERYLTLGPAVPAQAEINWTNSFCLTETRFGRHGGSFAASAGVFKAPLSFLKEGAVMELAAPLGDKPIIGSVVDRLSKHEHNTIYPGYSIVLPISLPGVISRSS